MAAASAGVAARVMIGMCGTPRALDSAEAGRPPTFRGDELLDARPDLVANLSCTLDRLALRIPDRPILALQSGHDRACLAAAHGDEQMACRGKLVGQPHRPGPRKIDADLAHDGDNFWMDAVRGFSAGGGRPN